MSNRAPAALVLILLFFAAGPLLGPLLPAGPAALLIPGAAAVGAAAAAMLFATIVWPAAARRREPRRLLADGLLILAATLPFPAGLAFAAGIPPARILAAEVLVAATVAAAGLWLAGPGRTRERDRFLAAGAVALFFGVPFGNYVLNEFGVADTHGGYALSPLLAARSLLLDRPGAGAGPALLLLGGVAAAGAAARLLLVRRAAVVAAALLFGGSAVAAEAVPLLGDRYVPGRPLPVAVKTVRPGPVAVELPIGRFEGDPRPDGAWVVLPGTAGLSRITVVAGDGREEADLALREVVAGRLAVALAPRGDLHARLEENGYAVSVAAPGAETLPAAAFLAADLVFDPLERLPAEARERLRAAGVPVVGSLLWPLTPAVGWSRRPWEEPGRVLSADDLHDLFGRPPGPDPGRPRTALLVLGGFAAAFLAAIRWAGERSGRRAALAAGLAAVATAFLAWRLPPPAVVRTETFTVAEGGRRTTVVAASAGRAPATWRGRFPEFPLPLHGRAPVLVTSAGEGGYEASVPLAAGETRLFVRIGFGPPPGAPAGPPDLRFGPAGLAPPGEEFRPAGEVLRTLLKGDDVRSTAVRKLLTLAAPPPEILHIHFAPGEMTIRRPP